MGKKIINLTLPLVTSEIEAILANYPQYPYQEAFANSDLRLNLIAYVLSRIPNQYTVIEEAESYSTDTGAICYSTKQLLDIEYWIHRGIREILHVDSHTSYRLSAKNNFPVTFSDGWR